MASETFRVRDRRNGNIRTVTRTAYMAMGPKVYEKLGEVDQTVTGQANVHRAVSAPVIRPQIKVEQEKAPEPEQAEVTEQAESEVAETINETAEQPKRRGRKPKNQISSDSDGTEK